MFLINLPSMRYIKKIKRVTDMTLQNKQQKELIKYGCLSCGATSALLNFVCSEIN